MTDPDLVRRAEQAYLGALLTRPGRPGVPAVTATDFTDPVHQAVYAAIAGGDGVTRPAGPAGWLGRLRDLLERMLSRQARQAAAYLTALPGLCPEPGNVAAYAAMVSQASQDRTASTAARQAAQAAGEDPVLADAGAWLDSTRTAAQAAGRRRPAVAPARLGQAPQGAAPQTGSEPEREQGAGGPTPALAAGTARLARALRATASRAIGPETTPPAATGAGEAGRAVTATQEDLERRVLASLIRHPGQGRAVAAWLPAEAFTVAAHRDLYDLVSQRLAEGRPVDPLIIAWDASRLPGNPADNGHSVGEQEPGAQGGVALARVALQVAALDPAPGGAEALGRALWADRLLSSTLGGNWPAQPGHVSRLLDALEHQDTPRPAAAAPGGAPAAPSAPRPAPATPRTAAVQQPATRVPGQPAAPPLRQPQAPAGAGPALRM